VAPVQRKARGERPRPAERDALPGEAEPAELSASQRAALARIIGALDAGESANFLLHGATGSGKTEVYLQACAAALERGRGAIVLVPEIALTPQALGRFRARFGNRIAVLHSALTKADRRAERARLELGGRLAGPLPTVRVVDLRREAGYPLSAPLLAELGAIADGGGKAILLLNRRGVAPALHCRACGTTLRCQSCDVALVLHAD